MPHRATATACLALLLLASACEMTSDPGPSGADGAGPRGDTAQQDVGEMLGEPLWTFDFDNGERGIEAGSGSVALSAAGDIYALVNPVGGARIVYSIAADGTRNWKFDDFAYAEAGSCADPVFSDASNTLYVVCSLGNWAGVPDRGFETYVVALSAAGVEKWTVGLPPVTVGDAEQRNPLLTGRWNLALRPDPSSGQDRLYVSTFSMAAAGIPATIYVFDQSGAVTESGYASPEGIVGIAFGPSDRLFVAHRDGRIAALNDDFSTLWDYPQPTASEAAGPLAFDGHGRVFVSMKSPPGVQALHTESNPTRRLAWWVPTVDEPGPPSIDANGRVCVVARSGGVRALDAADGSLVWEDPSYAYTGAMAVAALADGVVVAALESAQTAFEPDGSRSPWTTTAQMVGISAFAADGSMYVLGRPDFGAMYASRLYAFRGPAGLSASWTRHRGDNANTARYRNAVD